MKPDAPPVISTSSTHRPRRCCQPNPSNQNRARHRSRSPASPILPRESRIDTGENDTCSSGTCPDASKVMDTAAGSLDLRARIRPKPTRQV